MKGGERYLVRTPLGVCVVTLERTGLGLGDRGGFEAQWVETSEGASSLLSLETFRERVKRYLKALYREQNGRDPGAVALNLASHQLVDDLVGWTKLNWRG